MRISDWSSDVCSSDLARNRLDHFDHFAQGMACAGTDIDRPAHGTKLGKPAIGIGNGADIAEIPENIQVAQFEPCRTALEVPDDLRQQKGIRLPDAGVVEGPCNNDGDRKSVV